MTSITNYTKEESFNSESFTTEEVVKKAKKTKSTTTKTIKTKTVKTFDQEEEIMLMESSKEVVSAVEPSNTSIIEESVSQFEENNVTVTSENGDSNTNKPLKKKSDGVLKKKGKKIKKSESGKENHISVKSSFSKFDALQKKENKSFTKLDNANNKSSGSVNLPPVEKNCKSCGKLVFQMEQIKAEKKIWHKSCFRCKECNKQLNVDTYQSHEGVLYCKPHFKTLFAPKVVEDNEPLRPRKAELIIRENQPDELPPDVIRSSDKTDLGLDEIHQLNIKSAFQLFEHHAESTKESNVERSSSSVKKSNSILSKLARFQKKGDDDFENYSGSSGDEEEYDSDNDLNEGDEDIDLIRAKRRALKEPQLHCANMNDIKTKFESGHTLSKEERREERKQEIQNIRSRLFMGKQARIKEMYQQAVAESEQTIVASSKKVDLEISDKARSIKERFEKGVGGDDNTFIKNDEDMSVFENGSTKKSRSLFLEMERNEQNKESRSEINSRTRRSAKTFSNEEGEMDEEMLESVDIAAKFRFFESYKQNEKEKKIFRITPPRDGVVKLPSPDKDFDENQFSRIRDKNELEKSHTASKMLSLFRQMEEKKDDESKGPKPLKRFTPPPDGRYYDDESGSDYSEYDEESEEYSEDDEEEYEEEEQVKYRYEDECIKAAISEERAKKLREKFEKWEKVEIQREQNNSSINLYEGENDESQIESAKSLRQKFESMKYAAEPTKEIQQKIKVNRFV